MTLTPDEEVNWQRFMTEPVSYTEGARLAACLGVPAGLGQQLLASPRLHERLSDMIRAFYNLTWIEPGECTPSDRTIALASADALRNLMERAGAIYWAGAIAGAVLTKDVQAIQDALGAELYAFALKNRDRSGTRQELAPFDTLATRISDDGWRCFSAWCDVLPKGVAQRVHLKLPFSSILDESPSSPFNTCGPEIVRRAAG
jgi:hypothetical protein